MTVYRTHQSSASSARPVANPFRKLDYRPVDQRTRQSGRMSIGNLLLLLVEVAAIVAVGWWIYMTYAEWRAAQAPEPITATVAQQQVLLGTQVLPGGHEPPTSSNVPAQLRSLVAPPENVALPTPAPGRASRIVIDAISVDAPVLYGDSAELLRMGVGHRIGTAGPGQIGNMVLSGHNDVYGEIFRHLDQLAEGDRVTIYSQSEPFTYVVRQRSIVEPTEMSVLEPTTIPVVTLISCYPYLVDTHRIVVVAELEQ